MTQKVEDNDILFRASGIGALFVEGRGKVCTDKQLERISELEDKVLFGKALTDNQKAELKGLKEKRDAPPELSDTAKAFIRQMWLLNKKGFYKELGNRYVSKGLWNEQYGLQLISDLDGEFYEKNEERITIGNITGEADVVFINDSGKKIIKDIKSSWSPETFMNGDLSTIYEAQGRTYLYLYDADEFHLEYTLTDCPDHLYQAEVWKLKNQYGIIDITEESQPLFDQLRRNLIFTENPEYTEEERRKTFVVTRDKDWEKTLLAKIPMAIEYYKSIKLNQK